MYIEEKISIIMDEDKMIQRWSKHIGELFDDHRRDKPPVVNKNRRTNNSTIQSMSCTERNRKQQNI